MNWVANTVVLIYGSSDAVLVDTFLSTDHTQELADWIQASGKNLITIYVTHAHGDHFFGIGMLEERFPGARAVATARIRDFNRLNDETETAQDLYDRMLQLYPDRVNPGSLWGAAHVAKRTG